DIGKLNSEASIPWDNNAVLKDNEIKCEKDFYAHRIGYITKDGREHALYEKDGNLTSAYADDSGWNIANTSVRGVQL
ncbi:hypothetical protein PFISCL1PPCAC_4107, partial [Pristionchus fissidentatus]